MKTLHATLITLAVAAANSLACGNYESLNTPQALALAATSDNALRAEVAIQRLRALGREGFEALLAAHAGALASPNQLEPKVRRALDMVAGQRDAQVSRLFWHTDLEQAKAEAQKLGRPILSLRLLGRLDEEFSCANSRYFRTALYPNREINEVLRDSFVLHWESVRPVPRVTIDYGDGPQARTHDHRQQRALRARARWPTDRRAARIVWPETFCARTAGRGGAEPTISRCGECKRAENGAAQLPFA
jgi:hypothetical protein